MRFEGYEDDIPDEEQVIEDVLGENPRARELRLMRAALEQRRERIRHELSRTQDERERARNEAKLAELEAQIQALRNEEAITGFVEASVRATLHKPSLDDEE